MDRIRTSRLLLRAYHPDDAAAVLNATHESSQRLGRWMDWVRTGPKTVDEQRVKLREQRATTLAGQAASYCIVLPDEVTFVGSIGLHPRIGFGALEIGYWVAGAHVRKGYISEAAAALTKIGFETHGVGRMEIHTAPDNLASLGVARRIGFQPHTIIRNRVLSAESPVRDDAIWAMDREQYAESPAASMTIEIRRRRPR